MSQKPDKSDQSRLRFFPGGFTLILTAIAISSVVILASVMVFSHYNYKNSQKKLFMEKWDSIAMSISREASSAINDAGLIDDEFASYLYWIPAISKEIVAIRLVDNQNNPIYATGVTAPDGDFIDDCARSALDGRNRFLFPKDFGGVHTIIATPVYINDKIEAVLLLTVNDSPENMGIKSAVLKPVLLVLLYLLLWTLIIMLIVSWLKNKVDNAEIIRQLQSRLSKPEFEKSDIIIEKGWNDIMTVYDFKAGSIYIKSISSGEFELKAHYPSSQQEAKQRASINFEPGDPCLQAIIHNKLIIYDKITKRPLSPEDIGKTDNDANMALPLTSESSVFGVLNLTIPGKKRLGAKAFAILKQTLDIFSASVLTALESQEKTSRIGSLLYILDIIESLSSADFVKTALGKISEKIASSPGVTFCSIFIMDERNKQLILVAEAFSGEGMSFKPDNIAVDLEEMPVHKVALISGQSQILKFDEIKKLSLNKHDLYDPKMENSTIHIIPLMAGKNRIGCFSIGTVEQDDITYNRKEYFENIAHYTSMVLKHILRYSETKKSFEQLRSTHKRQLMLAKFSVISELANGVYKNLNSVMQLLLDDVKKLRDIKIDKSLSEITELIDSHLDSYKSVLRKLENFASTKPIDKYRQMEVAHTLKIMETRLREDSLTWPVNLEKIRIVILNSGSGQILGDEDELYTAISNIVINAAEAMPYGGDIVLESKIEKNMAVIEISDQGSGMNEAEIKRIFEPFFTTKEGPARGLGLSLVQKILILHNGEIDVRSKPGKGCTFTLRIPLMDPDQTALFTSKKKSSSSIPLSS
ncbi:MAG: sensor histidine kinase [Candidatus Zixiibacteriota bacterium]|nr:MAG: sensor histidine kinase [candidate division Zixibacteria bacterium]